MNDAHLPHILALAEGGDAARRDLRRPHLRRGQLIPHECGCHV
jgi:hypothetical protein